MQVDIEMFLAASPPLFSPLLAMDATFTASRNTYRGPTVTSSSSASFYGQGSSIANSATASAISSLAAGINRLDLSGFNNINSVSSGGSFRRQFKPSVPIGRPRYPQPESGLLGRRTASKTDQSGQMTTAPLCNPAPLRSCLVIRPESTGSDVTDGKTSAPSVDESSSSDVRNESPEPSSPTKLKKRVVFADDKGLQLTQVRMMTEPSDCPPRWTAEFLEQVTGGAFAEVAADRWEITFPQPAADYLEFRNRIDAQNVSLENVCVQEADQQLIGSIKVKNLAFSKQVLLRITFDKWSTHQDVEATFVPSGLQGATSTPTVNLFDTFTFKVAIPTAPSPNRIEFCLCFKCPTGEFWDNNSGKNYVIVKPDPRKKTARLVDNNNGQARMNQLNNRKYPDALSAKLDYWSDFASWNHLVNDSPYW